MDYTLLTTCTGFDWDDGNFNKNQETHRVFHWECEQVFFNAPLFLYDDVKHSHKERQLYVLGRTDNYRNLFIAFTIRNKLIRVISARHMSKNERGIYEEIKKNAEV